MCPMHLMVIIRRVMATLIISSRAIIMGRRLILQQIHRAIRINFAEILQAMLSKFDWGDVVVGLLFVKLV